MQHSISFASQTEEIDVSKDAVPINIEDEYKFIKSSWERLLFDEYINRFKENNNNPLINSEVAEIIKNDYYMKKRQSMTPAGIVGEYDVEAQIKKILGEHWEEEEPNNPYALNDQIGAMKKLLPDGGEWININVGQQKNSSIPSDDKVTEKEINLDPICYIKDINEKENISVYLNTKIKNIYKKDNDLYYLSEKQQGENDSLLNYSLLKSLISIIMYIYANNGNQEKEYSINILTIGPKKFVIKLTKNEACKYINKLVEDLLSEEGMKHQWQYQCIQSVISTFINTVDRNNISDEKSVIDMLEMNKDILMSKIRNHTPEYNSEFKYDISNPPYCESAIEELYSTSKAIADDLISTLAGRYYIPIIKLLIDEKKTTI